MGMFSLLIGILAGFFVYNDARGRGKDFFSALLWGVGSAVMPIVMIPLYLFIGRKPSLEGRKDPKDDIIDIEATVVEDLIHCPMCGRKVKEDFVTCPYCSHTLKPKCQSCGQALKREWNTCPHCQAAAPNK